MEYKGQIQCDCGKIINLSQDECQCGRVVDKIIEARKRRYLAQRKRDKPVTKTSVPTKKYFLNEPILIIMLIGVSIFSWNLSNWHKDNEIQVLKSKVAVYKAQFDNILENANQSIDQAKELNQILLAPALNRKTTSKLGFGSNNSSENNSKNNSTKHIYDNRSNSLAITKHERKENNK